MDGEKEDVITLEERQWWRLSSWVSWVPTSMGALQKAERKILGSLWDSLESKLVVIGKGSKTIRTVCMNKEAKDTPLVLVHGMGSGVGLWVLNLEGLSKHRPVYAFDMLGFGRSSRPSFSKDPALAELEFIESIEEWREQVKLDKFIILGHSLGGYLSMSYAIRYPKRVKHLVLVDPWGFPEQPKESDKRIMVPTYVRVIAAMLSPFNPLAAVRAAGPWGPGLISRFRPDLMRKFSHLFEDNTVGQYIYHCNAQTPSGEVAFKNMMESFGWAKFPMIRRVKDLDKDVPVTLMYGSRSWIDSNVGYQMKYLRNDSYVHVEMIRGAGHHVYADKAEEFNEAVHRVCLLTDAGIDITSNPVFTRRRRTSESVLDAVKRRSRQPRSTSESSTADEGSINVEDALNKPNTKPPSGMRISASTPSFESMRGPDLSGSPPKVAHGGALANQPMLEEKEEEDDDYLRM